MNIYLIGICGITMGSIAIELKRLGHTVSGSDKGIYPPMSTMLKDAGIEILIGYKEEHIEKTDLVIVSNSTTLDNPEYIKCKSLNIEILSYPEVLKRFCIKENSIVVTGTFGKTTITAFLVHLFNTLKINPSYMIGGKALNLDKMVLFNDCSWSIVEGDEYQTSKILPKSKFFFYSPKYLILTSCEWDHTDIFKTEEEYKDNFVNLLKTIPRDGLIIANRNGRNVEEVINKANKGNITEYYEYKDYSLEGFKTEVFGKHNLENILAGVTLAKALKEKGLINSNLDENEFVEIMLTSIATFKGIWRRLNVLFESNRLVIVDDFAHSPSKFKATIEALKSRYTGYMITAIVEPNMGNRTKLSLNSYSDTFKDVSKVFIPKWRINKLKEDSALASGEDFFNMLNKNYVNVEIELDDSVLISKLLNISKTSDKELIVFMGSEPFRGMPEELVKQIKNTNG